MIISVASLLEIRFPCQIVLRIDLPAPMGIFFTCRFDPRAHTHSIRVRECLRTHTVAGWPERFRQLTFDRECKNPVRQRAERTAEMPETSAIAACRERRSLVCHAHPGVSSLHCLCFNLAPQKGVEIPSFSS